MSVFLYADIVGVFGREIGTTSVAWTVCVSITTGASIRYKTEIPKRVASFVFGGDLYIRVDNCMSWYIQHVCCLRSLPFTVGKDVTHVMPLSSAVFRVQCDTDYPPPLSLRLFSPCGTHAVSIMTSIQQGVTTTWWPLSTTNDTLSPLAIGPTGHRVKMFGDDDVPCLPVFTTVGFGNSALLVGGNVLDMRPDILRLVRYDSQTDSVSVRELPLPLINNRHRVDSIALDDHLGIVYIIMGRDLISIAFS